MFEIEYRPNIGMIPNGVGCIEIVYPGESPVFGRKKYQISVVIDPNDIYGSTKEASLQIVATSVLWKSLTSITVLVSPKVLKLSRDMQEHIISKVCLSLGADVSMLTKRWIIGHVSDKHLRAIEDIVERIRKVFAGKLLALFPANVATPNAMSEIFKDMFSSAGADVRVLNHEELIDKGFGLITGIGLSAENLPCLVLVHRKGTAKGKKIGVVGKGVTFDSGGLAVKPFKHMHDMKFDKIGAIYAAMTLLYCIENPTYNAHEFVGVFPFVENAISHHALRPGDVITSYSGKSVEITNPDAEGRLILADAFTCIQEHKLDLLIDMATLTGHANSFSCWHSGVFFTHTPELVPLVKSLSNDIGERMLDMPYWEDQKTVLKSNVADLVNSPLKCSDSTVAAMFLDEFVAPTLPWIHMDLAHETSGEIPKGNGIRTAIRIIEYFCTKK